VGFDPENLASAACHLPESSYKDDDKDIRFYEEAIDRMAHEPGVTAVAANSTLPMAGSNSRGDFEIAAPGLNYRLSDILCAVGIPQLERLEELLTARERLAAAYSERLAGLVDLPSAEEGDRHGWQAYVVQLDRRDEALAALRGDGIEAQIGTYALHRLGAYRDQGPFPGADRCYERALALPFHTSLGVGEVERVAMVLDKVVSSH